MQYLLKKDVASFIPVHPLPPGLALPSPLKPDGHVQVKLPSVFIQVALSTQSSVTMVHSSMSNTCIQSCEIKLLLIIMLIGQIGFQQVIKSLITKSNCMCSFAVPVTTRHCFFHTCTSTPTWTCSANSTETRWTHTSEATNSVHTGGIIHTVSSFHGTLINVYY